MAMGRGLGSVMVGVAGFLVATEAAAAHVTCVGDSITFGAGASPSGAYPTQLQGLLGAGYEVENDGVSGATLLTTGDLPYTAQGKYTSSTTWAGAGGDVVIQLGTNDSKPANWSKKAAFEGDCETLVAHYLAAPGKPRVWVNLPPPAFAGSCCTIDGAVIKDEVIPLLQQCAANKGVSTIDVYSALLGHGAEFSDGVHPNDAGALAIASAVRDALAKLPSVTLSSAATTFAANAPVAVNTFPTAAYGKVEKVVILEGTTAVGESIAAPFTVTLAGLAAGKHVLRATMTETGGRTAQSSATIELTVEAAPPDRSSSSTSSSSGTANVPGTSGAATSAGATADGGAALAATATSDGGCATASGRVGALSALGLAAVGALAWLRRRRAR